MILRGTPRLILREWRKTDRDLFREINADPKVMEFFPTARSHAESDAALERINDMIRATGFGFYALELRETAEPIGFCGIAPANLEGIFPLGTMEIGWRLATRFWGHGYVTEAAKSMLAMAFDEKKKPEIVSFAVRDNQRSVSVMKRIGLIRDPSRDFDHPRVPESHPQLKPHVTYALTLERWLGK
ncbi:GNAT family N-acetyltransferase [Agrobacterium rosae]|uniref:GNAT family N-acetyltransferase n=1 Tax=Agrobacterium rosae TaxID=1972867 RepID=A0AAE5RYX5_9HYPH|nr:GNAT family N-acetyltransferase [Agrobacterium rosae]KAA3512322.1 N-acetyltransferase [Agrobacterium rosae]KAA3520230.1 N-acetyltransferase [Agrobacterium rosae]MCM2432053.1 GNAT family N-acetyltransferase [Agrobacterium rosae]MDX8327757.1 GNAT family N-acetyltransferase [Agrobacterium rosae]MQB48942.1 N-acetyltransferase [Agrobacterium rosae]